MKTKTLLVSALLIPLFLAMTPAEADDDGGSAALAEGETSVFLVNPHRADDVDDGVEDLVGDVTGRMVLDCGGTMFTILGGTQSCRDSGSISGSVSISGGWTWTLLARGSNSAVVNDAIGDYLVAGCVATLPPVFTSDVDCQAVFLRNWYWEGTQNLRSTQNYRECPWVGLGCDWGIELIYQS